MSRIILSLTSKKKLVPRKGPKRVFIYEPDPTVSAQLEKTFRNKGYAVYFALTPDVARSKIDILFRAKINLDTVILRYHENSLVSNGLINFIHSAMPNHSLSIIVPEYFNSQGIPSNIPTAIDSNLNSDDVYTSSEFSSKNRLIQQRKKERYNNTLLSLKKIRESRLKRNKALANVTQSFAQRQQHDNLKGLRYDLFDVLTCSNVRERRLKWKALKAKSGRLNASLSFAKLVQLMRRYSN